MMSVAKLVPSASAVVLLTAGASVASAQQADSSDFQLEEIVVTARKVSERWIDVPSAISVVTGESMLQKGMTSFKDLAATIPGLQFTQTAGTGSPVIRGITDGADNAPTVAIVVNGAPIGTSSKLASGGANTLDLDPLDVAQIEVLRGPQGTLYGANTLGGILSYTLATPNLTETEGVAQGEVAFTKSGDPSYTARAAISTPLVDGTLGVRLSGYYDLNGGFIDNKLLNRDSINENDSSGVHGALLWQPNDALRVDLHGFYQETTIDSADLVPYLTTDQKTPRDGDYTYNEYLPFAVDKRISAGIANISYDFDFATLTSVTSYQDFYLNSRINATGGALRSLLVNTLPFFGGPIFPAPGLLEIDVKGGSTKFTQELRLSSRDGERLSWIVGGFYADENTHGYIPVYGVTTAAEPISALNPSIFFDLPSTLTEYSAFANVSYNITPTVELTGGIRYGEIDQTFRQLFYGNAVPAYNAFLTFFGVPATPADTGVARSSESETTYLATATWHFNPSSMVYARFATGYRPGGPNVQVIGLDPTFDPDSTLNHEIGYKTEFMNRRGTFDLALYHTDWKDIQIGVSSGGITGFGNGGDGEIYGVEAQTSIKLTPEWTIAASFNYADGEITRVNAGSSLVEGGDMLYLPEFSGSATVDYRTPISNGWEAYGTLIGRYNGSRYGSAAPLVELPSYTLADLHTGVSNSRYAVNVYVQNLTDEDAQLASWSGYGNFVFVQRPRTYGVSFTARY